MKSPIFYFIFGAIALQTRNTKVLENFFMMSSHSGHGRYAVASKNKMERGRMEEKIQDDIWDPEEEIDMEDEF